jgi:hypothetical protein
VNGRLVFVYNANAGLIAGALDSIHKTLSPDTYACDLCAITHGFFTMRPQWRAWLKSLPHEPEFYHRPDFRAAFPELADEPLPLVGLAKEGRFSILLDAKALGRVTNVDDLVASLEAKLSQVSVSVPLQARHLP